MITINLYGIKTPCLIVPAKTGVVYLNQTGGYSCLQNSLEGYIIPVSDGLLPKDYTNSLEWKIEQFFKNRQGIIDQTIAQNIQELLKTCKESSGVNINWERLNDSYESWLHVLVNETEYSDYKGLYNIEAILTWTNSD
jgi:hypothetical protein